MRLLLILTAMIHQGGMMRIAALMFLGFCLLALGSILLSH
jgi:hypothetical protein